MNTPIACKRKAWLCALAACALSYGVASGADDSAAALSPLSEQAMKKGRILFLQCSACHALTPADNGGKIGPSLSGVFGRTAGSATYFDAYSSALKEAEHVWDRETMDSWLLSPSDMVPGTSMVFGGIADDEKRALLIRYLEVVTQP